MQELESRDRMYALAASGWLDLGSVSEALAELEHLSPEARRHPEVLMLRWEIFSKEKDWTRALEMAEALQAAAEGSLDAMVKRSFALHELKRTQEAWDLLFPMLEQFPKDWIVPYNLACYACQLGRNDDALRLLKQAIERGQPDELRRMALEDSDLEPLRPDILRLRPE